MPLEFPPRPHRTFGGCRGTVSKRRHQLDLQLTISSCNGLTVLIQTTPTRTANSALCFTTRLRTYALLSSEDTFCHFARVHFHIRSELCCAVHCHSALSQRTTTGQISSLSVKKLVCLLRAASMAGDSVQETFRALRVHTVPGKPFPHGAGRATVNTLRTTTPSDLDTLRLHPSGFLVTSRPQASLLEV